MSAEPAIDRGSRDATGTGRLEDRLAGTLLGTALGDALGLPAEGLGARAIRRRFGRLDRFRLLGSTGFVSDDTEQSALVAQSLRASPTTRSAASARSAGRCSAGSGDCRGGSAGRRCCRA